MIGILGNCSVRSGTSRGRQRKSWSKVVNDLLVSLELDKEELLGKICRGNSLQRVSLQL